MRSAEIYYCGRLAGVLKENDAGYEFRYSDGYLPMEKLLSHLDRVKDVPYGLHGCRHVRIFGKSF